MNKIKIETLTSVHIGSGRDLSANTEYIVFNESDDQKYISVIDEQKVLDIIGEENINHWVNIINNQKPLKDYLLKRKQNLRKEDVAKRSIQVFGGNIEQNKSLNEQLHDARELPYIPGSSIKGAIRTAILADLVAQNKAAIKGKLQNKFNKRFSAQEVEKYFFGDNPNTDVFRFLQVGDAYFRKGTIGIKAGIYNRFHDNWDFKRDGFHLVECIGEEEKTEFNLKINTSLLEKNRNIRNSNFLHLPELMRIINSHTKQLLETELEFWKNENNTISTDGEYYQEGLEMLLEDVNNCTENECVLRIGFGSGWNFITGGWAKDPQVTDDYQYNQLVNTLRKRGKYSDDVPFPKTRKFDDGGYTLGFVKLSV